MKANAPEKIWVHEASAPELIEKLPYHIEYTRADVFVEKAWDWIEDNILSSNQQDKAFIYYEQFKKYLEK